MSSGFRRKRDFARVHSFFGDLISTKVFVGALALLMGLFDILSLANFMYQKDVLKMKPGTMQLVMGLISIPWSVKPVFGYIVDQILSRIRYTKFLVVGVEVVRLGALLAITHFELDAVQFYSLLLCNSLCTLFENIVCEYTLVMSSKRENEEQGTRNANHLPLFFGFRAFGGLLGNFFGGRIVKYHSIKTTFAIASCFPMIAMLFAVAYNEKSERGESPKKTFAGEISVIKELLTQDNVFQMMLFLCLINLAPNFDMMYNFYMTDFLRFSTEDLANFTTLSSVSYICGLMLYTVFKKKIQPQRFFTVTNFILWLINCSFLLVVTGALSRWGWNEKLFCMLTQGASTLVSELNYMPILAIWCAVCPRNLEATSITLFTGLMNLSANASNYLGSAIIFMMGISRASFGEVWKLVLIQNAYLLLVITGTIFISFPTPKITIQQNSDEEDTID